MFQANARSGSGHCPPPSGGESKSLSVLHLPSRQICWDDKTWQTRREVDLGRWRLQNRNRGRQIKAQWKRQTAQFKWVKKKEMREKIELVEERIRSGKGERVICHFISDKLWWFLSVLLSCAASPDCFISADWKESTSVIVLSRKASKSHCNYLKTHVTLSHSAAAGRGNSGNLIEVMEER